MTPAEQDALLATLREERRRYEETPEPSPPPSNPSDVVREQERILAELRQERLSREASRATGGGGIAEQYSSIPVAMSDQPEYNSLD